MAKTQSLTQLVDTDGTVHCIYPLTVSKYCKILCSSFLVVCVRVDVRAKPFGDWSDKSCFSMQILGKTYNKHKYIQIYPCKDEIKLSVRLKWGRSRDIKEKIKETDLSVWALLSPLFQMSRMRSNAMLSLLTYLFSQNQVWLCLCVNESSHILLMYSTDITNALKCYLYVCMDHVKVEWNFFGIF